MIITYRTSLSGRSNAAYAHNVRIGYVDQRKHDRWVWQLILLKPEGNAYIGVEDNEEDAKAMLTASWHHWLVSAGIFPSLLELKTALNDLLLHS